MGIAMTECELNFGCLGMRDVEIVGEVSRNIDGSLTAEIQEVWLELSQRGVLSKVNVYGEIAQIHLQNLSTRLVSAYLLERFHKNEGVTA